MESDWLMSVFFLFSMEASRFLCHKQTVNTSKIQKHGSNKISFPIQSSLPRVIDIAQRHEITERLTIKLPT